jgi:hypothetical protein
MTTGRVHPSSLHPPMHRTLRGPYYANSGSIVALVHVVSTLHCTDELFASGIRQARVQVLPAGLADASSFDSETPILDWRCLRKLIQDM